ncbi:MAG TPA: 2,5-diamino-6-(ribosylamino)-4(3H)-pyrimidinone 5'-phosphate reductase [Thermoplasmata archaeon]|jgi:2,5-diamino-6-(ribosylamino)-4(3H)-pyrimidinone 5'-phosphate reductase
MDSPNETPTRRPAVWVNCAASLDGRLAFAGGKRAALSCPEDLERVQRLRADSDAVLVGVGTVVQDDPSLRVHWELLGQPPGKNPTRVVVDASGRTPPNARVLDGSTPTIVATSERSTRAFPPQVTTVVVGATRVDLPRLFTVLYDRGIRRLMVEGGAEILSSVLRAGLFDRFSIYYAPMVVGGATAPPVVSGPETRGPEDTTAFELIGLERVGVGYLATYAPPGRKGSLPNHLGAWVRARSPPSRP